MAIVSGRAPFTRALFDLARETDTFWMFALKPCSILEVDPKKEIKVRKSDRMVHAQDLTAAASNGKKRFESWFRLDGSKAFISALERSTHHCVGLMGGEATPPQTVFPVVKIMRTGPVDERGAWIHVDLVDKVVEWAKQPPVQQRESPVQERVSQAMPGSEREVQCPAGVIDIIAHDPPVIVEVKEAKDWMKGIGQLFSYGHYFPGYQKRLFIFRTGKVNPEHIRTIEQVCEGCGIELALDEDFYDDV
eukprot:jgi/Mesvir1/24086/Mv10808-RA.1